MMDAGLTVELLGEQPDELPADWQGDKRQLGLGQARERGIGAARGEYFVGCGVGCLVLVP